MSIDAFILGNHLCLYYGPWPLAAILDLCKLEKNAQGYIFYNQAKYVQKYLQNKIER